MGENLDQQAKIIWNYMLLDQTLKKSDVVVVLGSYEERVAEYAAELYQRGYSNWFLFSGSAQDTNEIIKQDWQNVTEGTYLANIARKKGIPEEIILVENRANNTAENIKFSYSLLKERRIKYKSLTLVHKPFMERRTLATFEKQWPGNKLSVVVTSPKLSFDEYINAAKQPKEIIIQNMLNDLKRLKKYAELGYQTVQEIPDGVWYAYEALTSNGYKQI